MFIHIDDDPVHTVEGPARMCTIGDDRTRTILATWIVMGSRTIVARMRVLRAGGSNPLSRWTALIAEMAARRVYSDGFSKVRNSATTCGDVGR